MCKYGFKQANKQEATMRAGLSALMVVAALLLSGCVATPPTGAEPLSAAQVRSMFIDREWKGPDGTFLFSSAAGTYRFRPNGAASWKGPWNYRLEESGVITGAYTNYTFYRLRDGNYQYHHSRSGNFYPIFL